MVIESIDFVKKRKLDLLDFIPQKWILHTTILSYSMCQCVNGGSNTYICFDARKDEREGNEG